jgi:hypothetical protein
MVLMPSCGHAAALLRPCCGARGAIHTGFEGGRLGRSEAAAALVRAMAAAVE